MNELIRSASFEGEVHIGVAQIFHKTVKWSTNVCDVLNCVTFNNNNNDDDDDVDEEEEKEDNIYQLKTSIINAVFSLVELLLGYMLQPTSSEKCRLFGGKKGLKTSFNQLTFFYSQYF